MRRTWTIVGVADVARSVSWYQTLLGLANRPLPTTTSVRFSTRMARFCSAFISGDPWASHVNPTRPTAGQRPAAVFRVDDFDEALPRARWYPGSRRSRT